MRMLAIVLPGGWVTHLFGDVEPQDEPMGEINYVEIDYWIRDLLLRFKTYKFKKFR
jgi:hypothetical protein